MEPFKNLFSPAVVSGMAGHLARVYPAFPRGEFAGAVLDGFEALELKQRSDRITGELLRLLPAEWGEFSRIMVAALHPETEWPISEMRMDERGIAGWPVMPMAMAVARRATTEGPAAMPAAMAVLREMTMRFSSEFAVRPLIAADPAAALAVIDPWTRDANVHVRRLASEGTRPRLPWGLQLRDFVGDPAPLLPLLEQLRADPAEYVRRSVANSLNDIAKDHPGVVLDVAGRWLGHGAATDRLVKHACRTLLKRGDPRALRLFGFHGATLRHARLHIATPVVPAGGAVEFQFTAHATGQGTLRLEYALEFPRATGAVSRKVFKISERPLPPGGGPIDVQRRHDLRDRSIRRHHPGLHRITMLVNGEPIETGEFTLE